MAGEIRSSAQAVAEAVKGLSQGNASYSAFRLSSLLAAIPVDGSGIHDDTIASAVTSSLTSWEKLMEHDKRDIGDLHRLFENVDIGTAKFFSGGLGGR